MSAVLRSCSKKAMPYAVVDSRVSPFERSNSSCGRLQVSHQFKCREVNIDAGASWQCEVTTTSNMAALHNSSKAGSQEASRLAYSKFATLRSSVVGFPRCGPIGLALAVHPGCSRYGRRTRRITNLCSIFCQQNLSAHNGSSQGPGSRSLRRRWCGF